MTTTPTKQTPDEVRTALVTIEKELNTQLKERAEAIKAILFAVLAKEHVFILGRPGTAKSLLTRMFFERIDGCTYFESVLSKTRPAEAILGPYNIPQLRDHGELHRKVNGFLPTANFAMLDEVGKMSPTLGHDLLAVVLERRLHEVNGGRSWLDVPLYSFIGGSNELPTDESDDAAALWDRMLVRVVVDSIQETGNWVDMLTSSMGAPAATVDFESLANVIDNEVPAIALPKNVLDVLVKLRDSLRKDEIDPSDRRWRQSVKLIQASAWLAGRTQADVIDIGALRFALWDTPVQIQKVERATLSVSDPMAEVAIGLMERIEEISKEARKSKKLSAENRTGVFVELNSNLKVLSTDYAKSLQEAKAAGMPTERLEEVGAKIVALKQKVVSEVLGMDATVV